jgi:hypothetical protein
MPQSTWCPFLAPRHDRSGGDSEADGLASTPKNASLARDRDFAGWSAPLRDGVNVFPRRPVQPTDGRGHRNSARGYPLRIWRGRRPTLTGKRFARMLQAAARGEPAVADNSAGEWMWARLGKEQNQRPGAARRKMSDVVLWRGISGEGRVAC